MGEAPPDIPRVICPNVQIIVFVVHIQRVRGLEVILMLKNIQCFLEEKDQDLLVLDRFSDIVMRGFFCKFQVSPRVCKRWNISMVYWCSPG